MEVGLEGHLPSIWVWGEEDCKIKIERSEVV
jgi:hypothetical protein